MANRDSYVGFAVETAYGTYVEPTRSFEAEADFAKRANQYLERQGLRAGRQTRRVAEVRTVARGAAGSMPVTVMQTGFGMLFNAMLDTAATETAAGATTARLMTFASLQEFGVQSLSCQVVRGTPTDTQAYTYKGGTISGWELTQSVDDYLKLSVDLDFAEEVTDEAAHTATYPADADEFAWPDLAVTLGGSAIPVRELKITAARGLNLEKYRLVGSAIKRQPVRVNDAEYTAEFTIDYENEAAYDLFVSGDATALVCTWTGPTAIESTNIFSSLTVTFPEYQIRGDTPEAVLDSEQNAQPVSGIALYGDTSSAIIVEYVTLDQSY